MNQEYLKSLFEYDKNTGLFIWKNDRGSNKVKGKVAGTTHKRGYIELKIDCKKHKAHRMAWLYEYGEFPEHIDHINGIVSDNRIENLRSVSHSINMKNRKRSKNSSREYRNIYKNKNRYNVAISEIGYIGSFIKLSDAVKARDKAMIEIGYTDRTLD